MKVALVTGGGTGIGRAAALELNKIDFVVYVVGRREEELNKTSSLAENKNFKIIPVKTDITNGNEVIDLFHKIKNDHGMVVPDIEKALEHYKNVFNKIGSKPIISETQNVKISFVEFSNVKLELIEPISDKSPISNFLKKNPLGGMHHIGLEVDDFNNTYIKASNNDLEPLSKPVKGYHGKDLFFLHPKKMMNTLFEILSKN